MASPLYYGVIGSGGAPLCETAALLADVNERPLTSWSCAHHILDHPQVYPTEARTLASISEVTRALVEVLNQFQWQNVDIVFSGTSQWLQTAVHVELMLNAHGFNVRNMMQMQDYESADTRSREFRRVARDTKGN